MKWNKQNMESLETVEKCLLFNQLRSSIPYTNGVGRNNISTSPVGGFVR